jgi:predicted Kef-type K+ transport protein
VSFATLALVVAVGLLGPLLASRAGWNIPVVIGELLGGLVIGISGVKLVDASEPTFTLLANIGFGLAMFVVGSRVPVRDRAVRSSPAVPSARHWWASRRRFSPRCFLRFSAPVTPCSTGC